jgi:hypothetical protein
LSRKLSASRRIYWEGISRSEEGLFFPLLRSKILENREEMAEGKRGLFAANIPPHATERSPDGIGREGDR